MVDFRGAAPLVFGFCSVYYLLPSERARTEGPLVLSSSRLLVFSRVSVAALRALIEQKFPDAVPVTRSIVLPAATGIAELDRALPHGGFPLSRLSICEPRGGATAMLRSACQEAIALGHRAAWIDGARTIAGAFWDNGPLLVRPDGHTRAVRAADELLRSGGFRLVVLTGVTPTDADTLRLGRAAKEGGGALVAVTTNAQTAALRVASRILKCRWRVDPFGEPAEVQEVRVAAHVRALGWDKRAEFSIPVRSYELRLSLESGLADRRGLVAARRNSAHTSAARLRGRARGRWRSHMG